MRIAIATVLGTSPYSQSRRYTPEEVPFLNKESKEEYEKRTWREKAHYDENGMIYIPPMAFKMALDKAASRRSEKIPGKRNATYTKNFLAGVLCMEPVPLGVHKDEVKGNTINANADGKRGSGSRVWRTFPKIDAGWRGNVEFAVLDDEIPADVFERTLRESGSFVGLGQFRPENGGFFGRFSIEKVEWRSE